MNYDVLSAIIFSVVIILILVKKRKKFEVQGKVFFLYKTKIGIKLMDKIATTFPKLLNFLSYFVVFVGISGMVFFSYMLIKISLELIASPTGPAKVAPLLPYVPIEGVPTLSFWHWIITILIIAVIHEFSHGIFARLNKVRIKSSGFAFLGPILAAFVEPDEKELSKLRKKDQLVIFSAGSFANIIFGAFVVLITIFAIVPLESKIIENDRITANGVLEGYPAEDLDLDFPLTILAIDNQPTLNQKQFGEVLKDIKPNEEIKLLTDKGEFVLTTVEHPNDKTRGFMGITFSNQHPVLSWVNLLLSWIFLVSIMIGLFNLLPLPITDGGRMLYVVVLGLTKDEHKTKKISGYIAFVYLSLLIMLFLHWLIKLFI